MSAGNQSNHSRRMQITMLIISLLSIALTTTFLADDQSIDEKAIRLVLSSQVDAWNRGDLKGFMAGYRESPKLTFQSGGDRTEGWNETYARYRKRYQEEGKEMGQLTFDRIELKMLSENSAYVLGQWKLKLKSESPSGLFTLIMKKTDQGWKIVHDHTSVEGK
jgi:ketosteroid isomerase-like protein